MPKPIWWPGIVTLAVLCHPIGSHAQSQATTARTIEFKFSPTARAQIALWIEAADGRFLRTVGLTQAVSVRGIGNRPGAAQMNSAFRWPYGRREGVLPVWAHRRAAAPNAAEFGRVIFQNRASEGDASRTSEDFSREPYFCLSFTPSASQKDGLDAISCATTNAPQTDKGRYITPNDVAAGYSEPAEINGQGVMRPLGLGSLYPPRRDVTPCPAGCLDTADVAQYGDDVRRVMPEIDTITMATPPESEQSILFSVPEAWANGGYVAWLEINLEGDYDAAFNGDVYRTPMAPTGAWDYWAMTTGYPYRGQPSIIFKVPFDVSVPGTTAVTAPSFYGDVDGFGPAGAALHEMDALISDDPANAPGSGADRLHRMGASSNRFEVMVRSGELCQGQAVPEVPGAFIAAPVSDSKHSQEWGQLHFVVPASEHPIAKYEVRYSTSPISASDPATFDQALPAYAAAATAAALMVPTTESAGSGVDVSIGQMSPLTHYYVAIRAVDRCAVAGPYAVAELTTTRINFTQLSGCFVATAAYGSALEPEVESLRTIRDALVPRSPLFAIATDLYYRSGPAAAAVIARSDTARAVIRTLLGPAADVARQVGPLIRERGGISAAEGKNARRNVGRNAGKNDD